MQMDGCWTPATCGGTPIPTRQPVLSTPQSWARNPQCRIMLSGKSQDAAIDVRILLQQPDARMLPGTCFPFEENFQEIFVCVARLDPSGQRLSKFDKTRIAAVSLMSRRREVLLSSRFSPGDYVIVPSTWEETLAVP